MSAVIQAPREMVEAMAALRLPWTADKRLQKLMDRNTNGLLSGDERDELEALGDWSESISLVRADALQLLGRRPVVFKT